MAAHPHSRTGLGLRPHLRQNQAAHTLTIWRMFRRLWVGMSHFTEALQPSVGKSLVYFHLLFYKQPRLVSNGKKEPWRVKPSDVPTAQPRRGSRSTAGCLGYTPGSPHTQSSLHVLRADIQSHRPGRADAVTWSACLPSAQGGFLNQGPLQLHFPVVAQVLLARSAVL